MDDEVKNLLNSAIFLATAAWRGFSCRRIFFVVYSFDSRPTHAVSSLHVHECEKSILILEFSTILGIRLTETIAQLTKARTEATSSTTRFNSMAANETKAKTERAFVPSTTTTSNHSARTSTTHRSPHATARPRRSNY